MISRTYSPLDQLVIRIDQVLAPVFTTEESPTRQSPADSVEDQPLDRRERRLSTGLMRVNHSGEVAAQALYQAQAFTARSPSIRENMDQAAREENDHLAWCRQRVIELGGHTSVLNPVWYAGAFSIGTLAGLAGDRWSLGFLAETERQVVEHLQGHLQRLPGNDRKSRAIVKQMQEEEAHHGTRAMAIGGTELPPVVKDAMRFCASIMTRTAYWL